MTTPDAPALTAVFVYGTLMPGERNEHVARQGGTFDARPATLRGHRLIDLRPEAYPGVIPGDPSDTVTGHILTYAPAAWPTALPFLDALEGLHETPPLYTRQRVTVHVNGHDEAAWVYLYARADRLARPGAVTVAGGDWRTLPERGLPAEGDR
ncbi:gamma-glutamylcyclotransferase family protein [Deinococcus sp.]|uniref:gamma-glutamylcyclotransferase family protein n=1 Tax=Deinococcus sp. TaxID=47478 RepID=UPI002869EC73|nr:gamma-glutamylcyclotransferase family protein [Deinococcus sp.]